jgi:hypothetical protein
VLLLSVKIHDLANKQKIAYSGERKRPRNIIVENVVRSKIDDGLTGMPPSLSRTYLIETKNDITWFAHFLSNQLEKPNTIVKYSPILLGQIGL